jgi:plastocyanin
MFEPLFLAVSFMTNVPRVSALLLIAPMLLAAGCSVTKTTPPTVPPANPPAEQANVPTTTPPENVPPANGTSTGMNNMMKPVEPPALTEAQKTELAAGEASKGGAELTFHVVGGNFFYVPNMIKVKKGDKVKIVFENSGGYHNFLLDEFDVKMDAIQTGESKTLEFTADKAGSFEYYCGVGQHRTMGQKGTLVVTE